MGKVLTKFFCDDQGHYSMMRLMVFILVINGLIMGYIMLLMYQDVSGAVAIMSSNTGIASILKFMQKKVENQVYKNHDTVSI